MSGDSTEQPASASEGQLQETAVDPRRMEVFIEAMMPPGPEHLGRLEKEAIADRVPIIRPRTRDLIRFFIKMKKPMRILEVGTAVGFSALFMQYYAPPGCRIVTIEKDPARAALARQNILKYGSGESPENGGKPAGIAAEKAGESGGKPAGIAVEKAAGESGGKPAPARCEEPVESGGKPAGIQGEEPAEKSRPPIEVLEGDAARILKEIREDASFDLIFMDAAKGQYIRFLPDVLRLLRDGGILITDNILQEGDVLSSRFAVTRRNRTIHSRMREYVRALAEEPSLETLLLPAGDGTAVCVKTGA